MQLCYSNVTSSYANWSLCYDIMLSHLTILLLQCADLSLYLGVRLLYFAILPLHSSVLQFRHWEKQLCCCDLSFSWRAFQYSVLSRYRAVRHDTQKRLSDKINYFPPKYNIIYIYILIYFLSVALSWLAVPRERAVNL